MSSRWKSPWLLFATLTAGDSILALVRRSGIGYVFLMVPLNVVIAFLYARWHNSPPRDPDHSDVANLTP